MKRSSRILAASLVAAVSFGVAAPAATAAPDRGPSVIVKVGKGDKGKATEKKATAKQKAAEKRAAKAHRAFDRLVERKDRALVRAIKETRVARLAVIGGSDTKAVLIENVQRDRTALRTIATGVTLNDSVAAFKEGRKALATFRAENYVRTVNLLRQAATVQAASDALGGNTEIDALVASAVEKALKVTATSPKRALVAARADLVAAKDALAAAEEPVTEEPVTEEPVTEEPVTEEPVTEEPVTEEPVTEEPVTEEPVTEEPVTEEPVTEPGTV